MTTSTMKAIIQRAACGRVTVEGKTLGAIGQGYVILLGVREGDTETDARLLAGKTVNLRIFPDERGKMNRSIRDINGEILVISQFTLYADTRKGNRPSFVRAAARRARHRSHCLRPLRRHDAGPTHERWSRHD